MVDRVIGDASDDVGERARVAERHDPARRASMVEAAPRVVVEAGDRDAARHRLEVRARRIALHVRAHEQIDGALHELRQKLTHLDLAILSVEPKEAAQRTGPDSPEGDPWSIRGQPKD